MSNSLFINIRNNVRSLKSSIRRFYVSILIFLFAFSLLVATPIATYRVDAKTQANLSVSVNSQTLAAGTTNNVNFTVTNNGNTTADQIFVTVSMPSLSTGGTSMILLNSDGKYYIDFLNSTESSVISAQIYVAQSAAGNMFQLVFSMAYLSVGQPKTDMRTVGISVPLSSISGAVLSMSLSTTQLNVGQNNDINLTVKNIGNVAADSLVVQLTLPGAQASSSALILVGSDGFWSFGSLGSSQQRVVPLKIFANPSASGLLISMAVTSNYIELGYKPKQQTNYLGIVARGNVNLLILGTSTFPSTVKSGMPFSLTVNFINLGTTTAQSMIITPNGTSGLQSSSTDKIFLGDLAVNIPSSFTISYTAGDVTNGSYNVNLNYTYKDSLGGVFVDTLKVPFKLIVGTNQTTQSQGDAIGAFLPYVLLVAAIAIVTAGFLYLRRRRARSTK